VQLDRTAGTREHQGVVAFVAASPTVSFEDLLKRAIRIPPPAY